MAARPSYATSDPAGYLAARTVIDENGCWNWRLQRNQRGYGMLRLPGRSRMLAHRWAFEALTGQSIPEGFQIDHLCRNTSCVNPEHLEAVTARENNLRSNSPSAANARKTVCHRGHPFTGVGADGKRYCNTCHADSMREWQRKRRAARRAVA